MLHGNIKVVDDDPANLEVLHHLEYVVAECMKKILDEEIYLKYSDVRDKEDYYNELIKNSS